MFSYCTTELDIGVRVLDGEESAGECPCLNLVELVATDQVVPTIARDDVLFIFRVVAFLSNAALDSVDATSSSARICLSRLHCACVASKFRRARPVDRVDAHLLSQQDLISASARETSVGADQPLEEGGRKNPNLSPILNPAHQKFYFINCDSLIGARKRAPRRSYSRTI